MKKRNGPPARIDLSRRRFLTGVAASTAALALPGCSDSVPVTAQALAGSSGGALPLPTETGIDHFVVVMMENRSFDHFLGWVPGADGIQDGLSFRNAFGDTVPTFHLASDPAYGYQGCGWADPNHDYLPGRTHLAGGAMNGWLLSDDTAKNRDDRFPVGYYTGNDLPFFQGVARHFTVLDRYFHGILAPTYPNRFYLHAGQTDRISNSSTTSTLPTVWDRMDGVGATSKYYFNDLPFIGLFGPTYMERSFRYEQFVADAASGQLPNLAMVDPRFLGENPQGVSNDDHPMADVRNGQAFLNGIYNALRTGPKWSRTLLVVCYDEWGGFYDHVVPPFGPVTPEEKAATVDPEACPEGNDGRLGFRVPCVILGPHAKRGYVEHSQYDVNSILNMLAWRFGFEPLGARGAFSANLAHALDFVNPPDTTAPDFRVDPGPFGQECEAGAGPSTVTNATFDAHAAQWLELRDKVIASGFKLD